MAKGSFRRQPPVEGGRTPLPSCVLASIEKKVRDLAHRNNVSRSWVIAVILAEKLGVLDQIHYDSPMPRTVRRKRK